jgi:hypothetical protein
MANKNFFDEERRRFTQKMIAEEFAKKTETDSTKINENLKFPGINAPALTDGEDVIEAYCKKHGISREDFDNIPAYKRRK